MHSQPNKKDRPLTIYAMSDRKKNISLSCNIGVQNGTSLCLCSISKAGYRDRLAYQCIWESISMIKGYEIGMHNSDEQPISVC